MNDFYGYLTPGKKGYLVGIGGVSMSPLAEVLVGRGLSIEGSDMSRGSNVVHLEELGIKVNIGHRAENIYSGVDFLVRTAAVHDDNPEIIAARALGIPVFERANAWGAIMRDYKNAVCISGTHGKTTTTSMMTHILMASQKDPTVMIGGTLPLLQAGHRVGGNDTIVMESCEYYNSFHSFYPTVAVILDIEADHLDFFKDLEDVKSSFRRFAMNVPEGGTLVINADDENTLDAVKGIDRKTITFGLSDKADVRAKNIETLGTKTEFDAIAFGRKFAHLTLHVPGVHNIMNALAATAAAISLGIGPLAVAYGLSGFSGAGRRFEFKGKYNGADVYDDYAHHPGELKALIDMVETLGYKRTVLVFQPHTYSRTKALFDEFVEQLRRPDICVLAEIYAAREKNTLGISSKDLSDLIPNSFYYGSFEEIDKFLRISAAPGDIILTVGAGDVYKIGENFLGKK